MIRETDSAFYCHLGRIARLADSVSCCKVDSGAEAIRERLRKFRPSRDDVDDLRMQALGSRTAPLIGACITFDRVPDASVLRQ